MKKVKVVSALVFILLIVVGIWGLVRGWNFTKTDKDKDKDKDEAKAKDKGKGKGKDEDKDKDEVKPIPKNCKMSPWVLEDECVKTDTGFNKMYKRIPLENARNGGLKCPPESQWERKGPVCTPEDCEVSQWNRSGNECQPQGDGTFATEWTRQILRKPRYGGQACPALKGLRVCPKQDCKMSEWVLDSGCVKTDTGFNKMYKRFPLENAKNGGLKCPPESQWERKGPVCTPEDCEVSQWNRSGNECQPQGDGTFATEWTRQILRKPRYGGQACPALKELRVCPKQDCKMSEWVLEDECVKTDTGFNKMYKRFPLESAKNGGLKCPPESQWERKGPVCPKQDCEWEWRPSGGCEYDNDGGFSTNTSVQVIRQPRYGGKACPRPQNRYTPCIPDDGIECETIVYNPDTKKTTVTEGVTLGGVCNTSG
jgi:hypothetical protein